MSIRQRMKGRLPLAVAFWVAISGGRSTAGPDDPPLWITRISVNANQTVLQWSGGTGPYRIQWRPTIGSGDWADVGTAISGTNRSSIVNTTNAFFRVVADGQTAAANTRYQVVFNATWSNHTHPTQFPIGAHFSGLIGATHGARFSMWAPGALATPGIESMAETGSKFTLTTEVNAAIATGVAQYVLSGGGAASPGSVGLTFDISRDHSLVSLVSMIAPSPDWFVGVHDLNLCPNGQWLEQVVIQLQPYDSGTDSGLIYSSHNANTVPAVPISQMTGFPFGASGAVPALGTFTFTRVTNP